MNRETLARKKYRAYKKYLAKKERAYRQYRRSVLRYARRSKK